MLTKNEQRTIERLADMMQSMDEMQKAQLCAFTEGLGTEKFQQEHRAKHRCEELNRWFKNYEATWEAR